jgi:hypothetical protein
MTRKLCSKNVPKMGIFLQGPLPRRLVSARQGTLSVGDAVRLSYGTETDTSTMIKTKRSSCGSKRELTFTPTMHAYLLSGQRTKDDIMQHVARSFCINWLDLNARRKLETDISFCASRMVQLGILVRDNSVFRLTRYGETLQSGAANRPQSRIQPERPTGGERHPAR